MIDLHCHILPGLDDGAQTIEVSLGMARLAKNDGIETIVATPHLFKGDLPLPGVDAIEKKRNELEQLLGNSRVLISIKTGAEVHISHLLIDEIRQHREILVLNKSRYMFVEFPSHHVFPGVKNLFFELMSEGIVPIIAHPERNSVFAQDPGQLYDLVSMGAFAQANSGSLTGLYGRRASAAALCFLENNLIHILASDGHNTESFPPRLSAAVEQISTILGQEIAWRLVRDNPRAVLEDRDIPYYRPPEDPRRLKKSFRIRGPNFIKRKS